MIGRRHPSVVPRTRRRLRIVSGIAAAIMLAIFALFASAGFFDADAVHIVAPAGPRKPIGAVYFTGDMGVRFGMSADTIPALAANGYPVYAINSPTLFAKRRTRAEVERIVADAVRRGLEKTGSDRLVLIGQSYGADILQTGLAALPADLRAKVAGLVLVVPGETVYFRADPSGIVYRGTPDSVAAETARRLTWLPFTCIYGTAETDSLCPQLVLPNIHVVAMPGGHFLDHDGTGLIAHVLRAIASATAPAPSKDRP
ncbi:AcvB/VirJ family lysyl-phosphatidylglycerol hydrolase [Sphingomonas sp. GB1N7]|uniref:AcvB/VirJ family lysyl-phosphatidylglycerol hydrolase n=1 Tax=Parasphingomonas caseinilytica TaxID=3096158 RepID=UPI002FC7FD18